MPYSRLTCVKSKKLTKAVINGQQEGAHPRSQSLLAVVGCTFVGCVSACALLVVLVLGVYRLLLPADYQGPTYRRLPSPDAAHVAIIGYRLDWKPAYGAVWIAAKEGSDNVHKWETIVDWSKGEAAAEWTSSRELVVHPPWIRGPEPQGFVRQWRGIEIRVGMD